MQEDALDAYTNGHHQTVLDPFAGVGTTLVEADLVGHHAVGFEINPYAAFAANLKLQAHRLPVAALRSTIAELHDHALTVGTERSHARIVTASALPHAVALLQPRSGAQGALDDGLRRSADR